MAHSFDIPAELSAQELQLLTFPQQQSCDAMSAGAVPSGLEHLFTPEVVEKVLGLCNHATKTGEYVSTWEKIQKVLLDAHLASSQQIPPDQAGVHWSNRSGWGVGGAQAQVHGEEVVRVGFSWKKASDACAFEKAPFGPEAVRGDRFNQQSINNSGGLIPSLVFLKILSVGAGHTNTFLRQLKAKVRAVVDALADENGFIDAEKITMNRPELREAVEKGLHWLVMHWACALVWPMLPDIIQNALNTDARSGQSEVELMLWLCGKQEEALLAGQSPDWKKFEEHACRSLPACANWMGAITKLVQVSNRQLLEEVSTFQKAYSASKKSSNSSQSLKMMGGEFIMKVAGMNFGLHKKPLVQHACLKVQLVSPPWKINSGIYTMLKPSEVATLTSKKHEAAVAQSEELMDKCRELRTRLGLDNYKCSLAIGMFDVRCILFILCRGKEIDQEPFESLNDIAED